MHFPSTNSFSSPFSLHFQLISAIKKISESYDALATFFEKYTPGIYNAALGVAENSGQAEEQLGDDKKKRKRKTKDPNAPKQPMSSYLIFSQKFRSQVKEMHPEMAPKDVASELGRMWREMSEEEKQVRMRRNLPFLFDANAHVLNYSFVGVYGGSRCLA